LKEIDRKKMFGDVREQVLQMPALGRCFKLGHFTTPGQKDQIVSGTLINSTFLSL
jgi:hypothetical protein